MIWQTLKWFFIFLAVSCQTAKTSSERADRQDFEVSDPAISSDKIPMSMWSPARRESNAGFYYMMGEQELLNGEIPQAYKLFQVAYNLDPNPFLARKFLFALAATGEKAQAVMQAQKMVLLYPKDAELRTLNGQFLVSVGSYSKAVKSYELAIDLDPNNPKPYLGLIQLYQFQKKPHDALVIAKELVKIDSDSADVWAILAKLYLASQQHIEALKPAKIAYELSQSDSEKILIYALSLELNGQSQQAVHLYEQLYRLNPTNEDLIARMIDLYQKIGDLEDALEILDEVVRQPGGSNPGVRMQQAFILWELERFEEAADILAELSQDYPESDRLLYMAALGQEKLENYVDALEFYQRIIASSQYKIHAEYRSVNIYRLLKDHEQALKVVKKVVASKVERSSEFYSLGAAIYSEMNEFDSAVRFLQRGYAEDPDAIQLLFLVGVYQEKGGRKEECVETMKAVLEKDPNHSSALNYLGYLFAEEGRNLDKAESLLKRALAIKPGDGYYLDSLGWVYYKQKKYRKALKLLEQANQVAPNEVVILEHLGDVYEALGQRKKAQTYYEQALSAKGEPKDIDRVKGKLADIEESP